ncbi:uncharacterized protein LOC142628929 [Castanea sativa]|uniref:uncharacterized protein LOC142628929 n=1 Tax=Castanea sativa TaxID=21020 RepID=UPI003F64D110
MEYLQLVKQIMNQFLKVKVFQVARGENQHADSLATLASSLTEEVPRLIKVELVVELSINVRVGISLITGTEPCWMDPIIDFLAEDRVPANEKEAERIRQPAAWYWLSANHKLYRRSFEGLYLQCLHPSKIEELLTELHEGVCGNHVGGRSLAHRAMTQGFWWSGMQKDAAEYARKCIVGPFSRATGNRRFVLVTVDYFTKWVEAEALANIWDVDVKKSQGFLRVCSNLGIRNRYSTLAYPQSNGQAEATIKAIVNGSKKRLDSVKGKWIEELPNVLWAYRITPRRSMGETPFSLTYGAEVVILAEVNLYSAQVSRFSPAENVELMVRQLNMLEEHRESATIRLAEYQQKLARRYNRNVRRREFSVGDTSEGSREHPRCQCRKASTDLGGTI